MQNNIIEENNTQTLLKAPIKAEELYKNLIYYDKAHDFSWPIYLHSAILHFIYQFLLGPLIIVYALTNKLTGGYYLVRNFQFVKIMAPSIRDTIVWLITIYFYYTVFFDRGYVGDWAEFT